MSVGKCMPTDGKRKLTEGRTQCIHRKLKETVRIVVVYQNVKERINCCPPSKTEFGLTNKIASVIHTELLQLCGEI